MHQANFFLLEGYLPSAAFCMEDSQIYRGTVFEQLNWLRDRKSVV